jgi:hypothetical protein
MKKFTILFAAFSLAMTANISIAATSCNYPTSLDSFTDKQAGDFLTVADTNKIMCAIEKAQAELGTSPSGAYSTVAAKLANMIDAAGVSGGQGLNGGSGSGEDLSLASTAHATKGHIFLGTVSAYDEANVRLGIGITTPAHTIHAAGNADTNIAVQAAGTAVSPAFHGAHSRGTVGSPSATQANDVLVGLTAQGRGATGYSGLVGAARYRAAENFTDTAQGTYFSIGVTPSGTITQSDDFYTFSPLGLRIATQAGVFAETALHLATINNVAAITFQESTATPADPSSSNQGRIYFKGDKFIIQWNDGGTVRFKYLDLTGTTETWTHTTSAP